MLEKLLLRCVSKIKTLRHSLAHPLIPTMSHFTFMWLALMSSYTYFDAVAGGLTEETLILAYFAAVLCRSVDRK